MSSEDRRAAAIHTAALMFGGQAGKGLSTTKTRQLVWDTALQVEEYIQYGRVPEAAPEDGVFPDQRGRMYADGR